MFWSGEKIEEEQQKSPLVTNFDPKHIEHSAYALGVDGEYAVTSAEGSGTKQTIGPNGNITIPPGQFAILLTKESVTIPNNAMAFISMKARLKLRGLVNVSGFHVDPGFTGRLKFSVYNAGSVALDIQPSQRLFLIWFAALDRVTTRTYSGARQEQANIDGDDVQSIRGMVASPAGLSKRIETLAGQLEIAKLELMKAISDASLGRSDLNQKWTQAILVGIFFSLIALVLTLIFKK